MTDLEDASAERANFPADVLAAHAELGEASAAFLGEVGRDPTFLQRSGFARLFERTEVKRFTLQPWPTFVGPAKVGQMTAATRAVDRLIKLIPERIFGRSAQKIAEFYQLGNPLMAALLIEPPNGIAEAMARGDFLDSSRGLRCIEWNCGSYLGGWDTELLHPSITAEPRLAAFLERCGRRPRPHRTIRAMLGHMARTAIRHRTWGAGPLNLALIVRPTQPHRSEDYQPGYYLAEYRLALEEIEGPAEGDVILCGYDELEERQGEVFFGERRIHAVFELHDGTTSRPVFRAAKAGGMQLFSGPITAVLSDKRNLALLSERSQESIFSEGERLDIERFIPWTRSIADLQTRAEDQTVWLPDYLIRRRTDLVIKHGRSVAGAQVHLGPGTSEARWSELVRTALEEGGWVAQELLPSRPYAFQSGEQGWEIHDLVWGLFSLGGEFGGGFVRLLPSREGGVINSSRGAETSLLLEEREPDTD